MKSFWDNITSPYLSITEVSPGCWEPTACNDRVRLDAYGLLQEFYTNDEVDELLPKVSKLGYWLECVFAEDV